MDYITMKIMLLIISILSVWNVNWVIVTVRKGNILVRMHIETFWAFKFRYVVLLQNLQNYSKKAKKPNIRFVAKIHLKKDKISKI